jgi:hypothetical protein
MQGFFRFEQKNFGKKPERETVKAWMLIDEVASPTERNGTCRRMALVRMPIYEINQ